MSASAANDTATIHIPNPPPHLPQSQRPQSRQTPCRLLVSNRSININVSANSAPNRRDSLAALRNQLGPLPPRPPVYSSSSFSRFNNQDAKMRKILAIVAFMKVFKDRNNKTAITSDWANDIVKFAEPYIVSDKKFGQDTVANTRNVGKRARVVLPHSKSSDAILLNALLPKQRTIASQTDNNITNIQRQLDDAIKVNKITQAELESARNTIDSLMHQLEQEQNEPKVRSVQHARRYKNENETDI